MKAMTKLTKIANERFHGEITLFKVDEYWRCSLGAMAWKLDTAKYNQQIDYMAKGETMDEAIENCIKDDINIYSIEEKFKED